MNVNLKRSGTWILGLVLLAACEDRPMRGPLATPATTPSAGLTHEGLDLFAEARLRPVGKTKAQGVAKISSRTDGIIAAVTIENAEPGTYNLKVHDDKSCGPDIGPSNGEFGNIVVPQSGEVVFEGALEPESEIDIAKREGLIGMVLVLHKGPGDFTNQLSADDDPVVSCGVIEKTNRR